MGINTAIFNLQVGKQSAKGTPAANPDWFLETTGEGDLAAAPVFGSMETGDGSVWGAGHDYVESVTIEGSPTVVCAVNNVAALLYYCLGGLATAGAADPYTHTITPAATGPYLTVWRNVGNRWQMFPDVKIMALEIAGENTGDGLILQMTPTFKGVAKSQFKSAAPGVPASKETAIYEWGQAEGAWTVDSVLVANITRFLIRWERAHSTPRGESVTPYDFFEGKGKVTAAFDLLATDFSYENKLLYGATSPADGTQLTTSIQSGNFSVKFTQAAGPPERSLQLSIPTIYYRPENVVVVPDPKGGEQRYRITGEARGTSPIITATVKNATATY